MCYRCTAYNARSPSLLAQIYRLEIQTNFCVYAQHIFTIQWLKLFKSLHPTLNSEVCAVAFIVIICIDSRNTMRHKRIKKYILSHFISRKIKNKPVCILELHLT